MNRLLAVIFLVAGILGWILFFDGVLTDRSQASALIRTSTPRQNYAGEIAELEKRTAQLEKVVTNLRFRVEALEHANARLRRSLSGLTEQTQLRLNTLELAVFTEQGIADEPTPTFTPTPTTTPTPTPTPTPTNTPTPVPNRILGVRIAPEYRCSPYHSDDYSYSPALEQRIINRMDGRIYSPYTGQTFYDPSETDIEHIVARSEAHDSGLCNASRATRRAFANDIDNLTLSEPSVNRHLKSNKDLAEWQPLMNVCWFAAQVVAVKKKYNLTMDLAEGEKAREILEACISTDLQILLTDSPTPAPTNTPQITTPPLPNCQLDPLSCYDNNGDGRIICAEARAHGIAPVGNTHPAYKYMHDADDDGMVCE